MLLNFLVWTLQCKKYFLHNKETPLKVAYFSKISESLSTGLAAKKTQNVEFCSTKMQDWVSFAQIINARLGI